MNSRISHMFAVLTADRRKAAVLGVLLTCLGVVGVKTLLKIGPSASNAADRNGGEDDPSNLGGSAISRTLAALERVRGQKLTEARVAPRLSRNLFAVDEGYFPPPAQVVRNPPPMNVTPPPRIEPVEPTADEARAMIVAEIRDEAQRLTLRSVIVGQHPLAVIEMPGRGRSVLQPGKIIRGFRLVEVKSDSVLLDKEGVRVRLWLTVTGLKSPWQ